MERWQYKLYGYSALLLNLSQAPCSAGFYELHCSDMGRGGMHQEGQGEDDTRDRVRDGARDKGRGRGRVEGQWSGQAQREPVKEG